MAKKFGKFLLLTAAVTTAAAAAYYFLQKKDSASSLQDTEDEDLDNFTADEEDGEAAPRTYVPLNQEEGETSAEEFVVEENIEPSDDTTPEPTLENVEEFFAEEEKEAPQIPDIQ